MSTEASERGVLVRLENVCKSFDGVPVLCDVSFEDHVTALAVIGPSGGGKSTLLRILGGLLPPTSGTVMIGETALPEDEAGLRSYRMRLGFVFQDGALFHHLSALDNIALPLQLVHGASAQQARETAEGLLSRLGLTAEKDKRPYQLSGGQKQRVAIARAIAPRPELLLLDEPTSALDPEYTTEILDIVRDLKQAGTRFIIVTHEMGFARRACDDIAFLCGGRLLEHGPSAELFERPRTTELREFLSHLLEWSM